RHPAPAAQGAGGRPNAAGGLRETGGPAIAGRAGADDRRAGTLAGAAHRTGPGRGAAARAAQLDAAAPTAPADPLLRSQRAIQVNVVATLGLARLKTSAKPPHSIPLPGPVAEVGLRNGGVFDSPRALTGRAPFSENRFMVLRLSPVAAPGGSPS